MSRILHLEKTLSVRPAPSEVPDVTIRCFNGDEDVAAWLRLRETAFVNTDSARAWTPADFQREFVAKRDWSPARMWLAIVQDSQNGRSELVVGAVALGRMGRMPDEMGSVRWLMVDPAYRRRGIGRLLLATLEGAAWERGDRRLALETHSGRHEAVELYRRSGYTPRLASGGTSDRMLD